MYRDNHDGGERVKHIIIAMFFTFGVLCGMFLSRPLPPSPSPPPIPTPILGDIELCNITYLQSLLPAILPRLFCNSCPIRGVNNLCFPAYALNITEAYFGRISIDGESATMGCTIRAQLDDESLLLLRFPTLDNFDGHVCQVSGEGMQGMTNVECRSFHDGMISLANTEGHVCCEKHGYFINDWGLDSTYNPKSGFSVGITRQIDARLGRSQHLANKFVTLLANQYYSNGEKRVLYSIGVGGGFGGTKILLLTRLWPEMYKGAIITSAATTEADTLTCFYWNLRTAYPTWQRYLNSNDPGDFPNPNGPYPTPFGKQLLLHHYAERKCDGLDGLLDNITTWPLQCDFDPRVDVPQCPEGTNTLDCLTPIESEAYYRIYQGPPIGRGLRMDPGSEMGWSGWVSRDAQDDGFGVNMALAAFPDYNVRGSSVMNAIYAVWNYTFTTRAFNALMNTLYLGITIPEDWSTFAEAGGKIIEIAMGADGGCAGIGYSVYRYERMAKIQGVNNIERYWRLFPQPEQFRGMDPSSLGLSNPAVAHIIRKQRHVIVNLVAWINYGIDPLMLFGGRHCNNIPGYPYPNMVAIPPQVPIFCAYPARTSIIESENRTKEVISFYCDYDDRCILY